MKSTTTAFVLLLLALYCSAQITQEAEYPNAALHLYMVNLELSGTKYIHVSTVEGNRFVKLYNLDHSLWKSIDCNNLPTYTSIGGNEIFNFGALYVSEQLFDCDEQVEFIYATGNHTVILKEDGTELLNEEGRVPQPGITHSQEYRRPIYNTPDGTKLILSDTQGGASYVYSLPCSLSTGIGGLINGDGLVDIAKAYPNPSSDYCRLEYKLPTGVDEALLVLFDSKGTEVAQFRIDRSFSDLLIPVYDYLPGVYVYQLIANGERMAEERIVIQH